jgi:hypothetical protein
MINKTKQNIINLNKNEIFVFGSNLSGRHGKGAAKTALKWGAKYGQCCGIQGNTYAIPTKDKKMRTLPLNIIKNYINTFINYAKNNNQKIFLVTEIGCGLAGYNPIDIAPLFKKSIIYKNIYLPESFWKILISI